VKTFARYFAITFGIVLGILLAVLVAGGFLFGGYTLYRADQDRRSNEQANARATVATQERATATTRQALEQATATTRQAAEQATATALRVEGEQQQRAAAATAEAVKVAARKCQNPSKLVVRPSYDAAQYRALGTVTNTCNFDIVFNLNFEGLAKNGVSIVTSAAGCTVAISGDVEGGPGQGRSALIRAGTERLFNVYLGALMCGANLQDIASVRVAPKIVREDDPPL
jgi:hypothetical protein